MNESQATAEALSFLWSRLAGGVLVPGDEGYESARGVWNGMIDKRPAAIVRCNNEQDVATAIEAARRFGLPLAVRGGGHNVAGLATCDGGIVADMSPMNRVSVDPRRRLATVQGGAQWRDVDAATQQYGLAAPAGLVSDTGVAGLTLGGGIGWLRRKHGLTCDNVVAAELVTADGRRVVASETENPELLWALRGGGGNFGIVTSFTFRLHPVGPEVAFVLAYFDGDQIAKGLKAFRDFSTDVPVEAAPVAFTATIPEGLEGVPDAAIGRPALAVGCVYAGPPEEGERVLRPLRELVPGLVADMSGRLPYTSVQQLLDEEYPRGRRYYWKSAALDSLSDEVIGIVVESARRQPSPLSTIDLWTMGGESRNEPAGGSAYAGRQAAFLVNPEANWEDPGDDRANVAWARDLLEALKPFTTGTYLNFPGALEEGERQLRTAFADHYERLVKIKTRWDPGNLFRLNHNVRPDTEADAA